MSDGYLELGQLRCWDKGQRGNIYKSAKNAKRQASRFRRDRPEAKNVRWYRCPWCGWYHLGSRLRGGELPWLNQDTEPDVT